MKCSLDTCFLIDWARYRRREILAKLFDYCFIVDEIFREIKSEYTIRYISKLLEEGFLVIYPFKDRLEDIIRKLIDISARDPRIKTLDPPETYALAIGLYENAIVLTENKGVLNLTRLYPEYSNVKVWRSVEVLREAYNKGLIRDFYEELRNYEVDTGHKFPRIQRR